MYYYCKKCGMVTSKWSDEDKLCDHCRASMYPVPEKYIQNNEILTDKELDSIAIVIREELVKPSPEFDQELFDHLEEFEAWQMNKTESDWQKIKATQQKQSYVPKCPTCGSPNIEKISLTSKAIGGALFGLFSSNVRKTMHCKNCGYKW